MPCPVSWDDYMKKNRQLLRVNHKCHSTLTAGAIRANTDTAYSIETNYHKFDFLLSAKAGGFHVNHILVCQTKTHIATV